MKQSQTYSEMDAILRAGRILVESGAEIYRVEETMSKMAGSLGLQQFDSYVVNRAVVASALNPKGFSEARTTTVPETSINLGKLEAVNALSRRMVEAGDASLVEVDWALRKIETQQDYGFWQVVAAYFVGAGGFSLALGSTGMDSLASALSGGFLGILIQLIAPYIQTKFLLNIFGASLVSLSANLLYFWGLGQHCSLIILGTLMVLIPGAFFVNAIREFSQNNYFTGLALSMSALLTCISISVGVAVTIGFLPFAEQMTSSFSLTELSLSGLVVQTLAAGIGTVAFAILYHTPKRYCLDLGLLGGATWGLYRILWHSFHIEALAIFIPALMVVLMSRILAVKRQSPATIFLSTSMFPLIPGLSFYRAVYFFITGSDELAINHIRSSFITAFTITIAIAIVQQLPLRRWITRTIRKQA
ncbi:uncharacterized membrane protein YjjP (DUF1212 family) [Streptococcus rupicaprae]|uniref:Uncharacterized membrane protein YjjP (DUF1212 family) n=1 Tax=Streptococcus rupicaprae TaxID=759619 RepID=A0ABV2FHI3_9STRE